MPDCLTIERKSFENEDVNINDVENCENWLENLTKNLKIISDVMTVKFEQKCNSVNSKHERICELENVLKTSVKIASERDNEYQQLVQIKENMDIKVSSTL